MTQRKRLFSSNRFAEVITLLALAIFCLVGDANTGVPLCGATHASADELQRPNIVWIMSEDNSKHYLKHFDPNGASTPAIESMAAHGITFDRAFSNAPVCSVARTTLITGCYGPRIGTQYHRKIQPVSMPAGLDMFPTYLRDAGYYTSNNSKEDYNATPRRKPWNESGRKASWQNRPSVTTPFFHVQTFTDSHESKVHFKPDQLNQPTDFAPDDVVLPECYPDTPLFRYTAAYYRDRMQIIDKKVASIIKKLKSKNQLENTFVFYVGDHGGVLPRSKGYVFESGLHVPLVVRIPEKYRSLVDRERGSRTNGFVSFIDFAPTVLNLAGVTIPDEIDGRAFLGNQVAATEVDQRKITFSYADRMDEKYDCVRAVRVGDWKYIRYFEAQYPNAFFNNFRYKMLAYQEWRELNNAGKLSPQQSEFFRPRPLEALFDLSNDPNEVNNLAAATEHGNRLKDMRNMLMAHLKDTNDLGFLTETNLIRDGVEDPVTLGLNHHEEISGYIDTANIAIGPPSSIPGALLASLNSSDPITRYWGLVSASSVSSASATTRQSLANDATLIELVRRQTLDDASLVAARAAELLAILGSDDPREVIYRTLKQSTSEAEALQILNIAAYLHEMNGQNPNASSYPMDAKRIQIGFKVPTKSKLQTRLEFFVTANP